MAQYKPLRTGVQIVTDLYIGLMSGTSADGIDAALVDFSDEQPRLIGTHYTPYSNALRDRILALCQRGEDEIVQLGELDNLLGNAFAQAVNELLAQKQLAAKDIRAIGSHGQTIRHYPHHTHPFTLQIADPNIIAARTGITTVADFRRKDVAHGGQGAPLVPAFHQAVFACHDSGRVIVNIGGIANVTILTQQKDVIGFDTGPGNTLLDAWIGKHQSVRHDEDGAWAKQGAVNNILLQRLLNDAYFALPAPKSTGREYFNLAWLQEHVAALPSPIAPADVQATLTELTARSIFAATHVQLSSGEILVCGGGVQNGYLMSRLHALSVPHFSVRSTSECGMDPAWIEAVAFAWLARETMNKRPGNLPAVTGAKRAAVLGGVYFA
jgi:anhydro-N-acetylmuramic acid kinase